jgi:putative ABC transport system substrate-binding protein
MKKFIRLSYLFLIYTLSHFSTLALAKDKLPVIGIANYGPHSSLDETIKGFKAEMKKLGYFEGKNIEYEIQHINFDQTLMLQMLTKIQARNPCLVITLSTPVTQAAKHFFKNTPIVFTAITDPVAVKLLSSKNQGDKNITGASDQQNLPAMLKFAKAILPKIKNLGLLYSLSDENDSALLKMMQTAATPEGIHLEAIPIDNPRDIPIRMQKFKNKVDLIYVGVSGPIQPSLPSIIAQANKLQIPVINADSDAVTKHQALASFAVTYYQVGSNTARIANRILKGEQPQTIPPYYPSFQDHKAYISKKVLNKFHLKLPKIKNVTIVE